jgi:hypothetical protein
LVSGGEGWNLGDNSVKRYQKTIMAITFVTVFVLEGITMINPNEVNGQIKERIILSQEGGRDPFLLPPGVHLLSNIGAPSGVKEVPPKTETDTGVKAILIADYIRLALIDRHIVTVGDSIHDEKVLEIKSDRVILGKGDQKRTLLLSQSPILLTVEEKHPPSLILPHKEGGIEGGKGE